MEQNYIIDKSWMYKYKTKHARVNAHFLAGAEQFMQLASQNMKNVGASLMRCPCFKCENKFYREKDIVHYHVVREGFTEGYTTWHYHGESRKRQREDDHTHTVSIDDMTGMLNDAFMGQSIDDDAESHEHNEENQEIDKFNKLMAEAKKPLYTGWSTYGYKACPICHVHHGSIDCSNTIPNLIRFGVCILESRTDQISIQIYIQSNNSDRVQCNESIHHNTTMLFRGARCNNVQMHSHQNRKKHFSIQFDGHQIQVEERRPSGIAAQDVNSKKQRIVHEPHTVGVSSNRVTVESTLVHTNGATACPLQSSNEVQEGNSEDIHGNISSHIGVSTTSTSKVRKTRGPLSKSVTKPPTGQKWKCMFIDLQPVGLEASKLAEVLGLYARNDGYFPPYKEWKEQSKQSINDVMKEILVEYDFVDKEGLPANMAFVTRFCEESISSKVKEWRANLKRVGYMKGVNGELSSTSPDERVTQPTWDLLLQYWRNPKKLQETKRNKKNRAEDHATHTLGAKSITRHNYEQQEKLGDSYSTLAAYLTAHQTKSGEYPDEYTRAICEKVIETCEEKNLTNCSEASVLTPVLDVVYNGHHGGYERGRGMGWCRGAWRRNMANEASNDNIRQLTTELQSTQTELQNAMATIEGMRTREREMEARQQEHMEAMRARERELAETMQAREREMQAQLNQMQAMLSMCLPRASVEDSRSFGEMSHSQPPRQ